MDRSRRVGYKIHSRSPADGAKASEKHGRIPRRVVRRPRRRHDQHPRPAHPRRPDRGHRQARGRGSRRGLRPRFSAPGHRGPRRDGGGLARPGRRPTGSDRRGRDALLRGRVDRGPSRRGPGGDRRAGPGGGRSPAPRDRRPADRLRAGRPHPARAGGRRLGRGRRDARGGVRDGRGLDAPGRQSRRLAPTTSRVPPRSSSGRALIPSWSPSTPGDGSCEATPRWPAR